MDMEKIGRRLVGIEKLDTKDLQYGRTLHNEKYHSSYSKSNIITVDNYVTYNKYEG